jgi:hypothetical protein
VRRAGRGRAGDRDVTWTVAEGTKGRRWREVVVRAGAIVHSLLLETFPDGRFAHLELSTPAGLLTLHPEPDGTLHGNAVTSDGVRHIRGLAWAEESVVLVEGSVIAGAAAAGASVGAIGEAVHAIVVRNDLSTAERHVDPRSLLPSSLDAEGLPQLDGGSWPLEVE